MKVLFVASECAPFVKTGGLADVIGAVPKALAPLGVEARVMLPLYPALRVLSEGGKTVWSSDNLHGGAARLLDVRAEGLDLLLLDAPHLFDRGGNIYLDADGTDWPDNPLRFGALSWVAADIAANGAAGWQPEIVHAHDWQAGLVPAYLHQMDAPKPPCVLTIHNIAFQGLFSPDLMAPLGLDAALYTQDGMEFYGNLGFLKAGLAFADKITTVSPTYAREIMQPEFGMGLEGLLRARARDVSGILNGIDTDVWNPETDPALPKSYSLKGLKAKQQSRQAVLERFGLTPPDNAPLFCVISRLTTQKGVDVLLDVVPDLVARGAGLAVLGSGDRDLEAAFVAAAHRFPGAVGVIIGYDEDLSHLMQGGSDAILIPSRFEPCGLTQLYGLRYGTIPVVARTGGLADTIIDANEAALAATCATGVQFAPVTPDALSHAIDRCCDLFAERKTWSGMMRCAMRHPVGWETSSKAYLEVYDRLLGG
ncbi:glycogen synthase [Roseobacter denitrificans]|uniref:Glycogen synthase n=1 Tax=Roseobacter denitrificans (strain ATCC 33942 / OCh 114) TaxID=375451 RepID=GLGA_ROSDO|nr:glycogen synthase GlgA [Roseobacter denitrificans]Q165E4.1 RecName: Full=Glycogen synthase; AltName: Full=Starch [bacterial glycogen] synthase [Roseobacter denitrificans OCh 114]ABG32399.1 glycogen synthase [Roseobacter denitrificans OCh 114]AVL51869.1 glycogen synthase [Roseobacter denitrificans]SFF81300.1 starch synthase [Roseobacter denitrificans OCh 114]